MKKKLSDQKKNFFLGVCNKCGEIYEASSQVDDLDGVTFSCKKMLCSGRIELKLANSSDASELDAPFDSDYSGPEPRRFC